ncbi:MAG: hypothetical protein HZB15_13010, partial [Actinobacteria bacterium]|nr:hypothetical protein [Actinomycetota bacterium]
MSPAAAAIARFECRRRWRSLLALALIGGILGGVVIGAAALTRRTATAPDRLAAVVDPGDAHLRAIGDVDLADAVAALPMVSGAWAARLSVARLDGPNVIYLGVVAELPPIVGEDGRTVLDPTVVQGRAADPGAADEVMLREDAAEAFGLAVGDTLRLSFLTPEEIDQFDTGFGEPDGPTVDVLIAGLLRVPPGVFDGSPVVATPAFTSRYPDPGAATEMYVGLRGGASAVPAFSAAVDELVASRPTAQPAEDFAPVTIDDPRLGTAALVESSRVLVGGLVAALIVAIVASLVVCAQAWSRHFSASANQQQIEAALGMSGRARLAARLVPGVLVAVAASAIAVAIALAASGIEPVGGLSDIEPEPGWRLDVGGVAVGAVGVVVVTIAVAAWGAARAGAARRDAVRPRRP